ncbi:MAG TPA: hypothetical protein VJT72_22190 [Pseudonocardiaceae bacterium]|nr:hypothetical protein [Pseudonocardiaceae bacterium]
MTAMQVHVLTVVSWVLLALDAALGVVILRRRWHKAAASPVPA